MSNEGMTFDQHQADTARAMGCTVEDMNREHDPLHRKLAGWLGVESYSLLAAEGATLSDREHRLAEAEEEAVMAVQRLIWALRNAGVRVKM